MNQLSNIQAVWPLMSSSITLWGLTPTDRLQKLCRMAGFTGGWGTVRGAGFEVAIRLDYVMEYPVLKGILDYEGELALIDQVGEAVAVKFDNAKRDRVKIFSFPQDPSVIAEFQKRTVQDISSGYNSSLRKKQAPYLLKVQAEAKTNIEWRMYHAAYKGATDFVTKYVWPLPAFWATRFCAALSITPNQVTLVSLVLVFLTMGLFAEGWFTLGIISAWLMTFLDTVDGKLARVTLRSSSIGNVFDHGIDLIHPPFWYYAWYLGIDGEGRGAVYISALWIILVGYVLGRLQEGLFITLFKIEIHTWRKVDYLFRLITARRNPNLFILMTFTMLNAPAEGYLMVALWTIVCLLFHTYRIFAAIIENKRGKRPSSWLQNA